MFNWLNDLIKKLFGIDGIEYLDAPKDEINQEVTEKIQEIQKETKTEKNEEIEEKQQEEKDSIDQKTIIEEQDKSETEQQEVIQLGNSLIDLQMKFQNGEITEEELTEQEIEELTALYLRQIEEVKKSIQQYQNLIHHFLEKSA